MPTLTIDTRAPTPAYLQILEQILARVQEGSLGPGTALPSVRQLASDLGINPNTVAKAYLLLERDGILLTVRRRGTFVAPGAREKALRASERSLEDAVERAAAEAAALGLDRKRFLEALERRLDATASTPEPRAGESS